MEISKAILTHQLESLSSQLIQHLLQYLPNKSEVDEFRHLSIEKEELVPVDRLIYEIIQIPFYIERLNLIKFQLTFPEICTSLNEQIQLIDEACRFLYQSKQIQKLLEIILSAYNHFNSTRTSLTLEELANIVDLKSPKTRTSLMNIVSQICHDRHPEIFELKEKHALIFSASKVELTTVKSELDQMKKQVQQFQSSIGKFNENQSLKTFLSTSEQTLDRLFDQYQKTTDQFDKTVSYYTNQTTTTTSFSFLSIFSNLISSLQNQSNKN